MNNAYAMSASFEARKNQQAGMITAGFAGLIILLLFLVRWELPVFEKHIDEPLVEINLPDEPITVFKSGGGGGGGNPVQAIAPAGIASASPQTGKADEDAKDVETDETEKHTATILKPDVPKPKAVKINNNSSVVKTKPTPIIETPAPAKPKAVVGRTLTGNGNGGGVATNYDRSGGSGNGSGVGKGDGYGGGSGNGTGGGNGPGRGNGNGPRVTRGDRRIVASYSFQGDLEKAIIYADVKVSESGQGEFIQFAKGSSTTSQAYKTAIMQYLRNIKFNQADHESTVTVQFNFKVT
jgi:hypothetical protein